MAGYTLTSWRRQAEDHAATLAALEGEDQRLAFMRVDPNVFLALLDVADAAQKVVRGTAGDGTIRTLSDALKVFEDK